jgi:hypothetical protein
MRPGTTKIIAPLTPLFAGRPTSRQNWPEDSYIPHVSISERQLRTVELAKILSCVVGQTPPFASVAAASAISTQFISREHALK